MSLRFAVVGQVIGFGTLESGEGNFLKIQPDDDRDALQVTDRAERRAPITLRYDPTIVKDQGILNSGSKVVCQGVFGVFHKDRDQNNGNGNGNGNGYQQRFNGRAPRPYTNYYFQMKSISPADAKSVAAVAAGVAR